MASHIFEQRLDRVEVVVNRPARHSSELREFSDVDLFNALLGKEPDRRVVDSLLNGTQIQRSCSYRIWMVIEHWRSNYSKLELAFD
jgi:hypothetical protein